MSFAARTPGFAGLPGVITTPSNTLLNTSLSTGVRSSTLQLNTDGSISLSGGTGATAWFAPIIAAIGTQVWVKLTVGSSTNTNISGGTGSWLPLSAAVSWSFQNSSVAVEATGSYTLSFATDSSGGNVVGSGSGTWDVGYAP